MESLRQKIYGIKLQFWSFIYLLVTVGFLFSTNVVFANNCALNAAGFEICGAGQCLKDAAGRVICADKTGAGCAVSAAGKVVCSQVEFGNCAVDAAGRVVCTDQKMNFEYLDYQTPETEDSREDSSEIINRDAT